METVDEEVPAVHEMGEWSEMKTTDRLTPERYRYLQHLRVALDDESFRLAIQDELGAPADEVDRLLYEAEMLANYGVA